MIRIDTNVLVALAALQHPDHARAVAAFEGELAKGEQFVLSGGIAAELLHVITDPRRFVTSHTMSEAVAWLKAWEARVSPKWIVPSEISIRLWLQWIEQFELGRKRLLDTQYAAMLHTFGVQRLLTNNRNDFEVFQVFEFISY